MNLSAIVIAKNEEEDIGDCIKSLKFCDEVIIIDDFSTDETVKIAKKLKAKVYKRKLANDFSSQRNFGLKKAKGEWVLFLDADEIISDRLSKEILKSVKNPSFNGYFLKRKDNFKGMFLKYGETGTIRLLRLGRRKSGKWIRKVHEHWEIEGKVGELRNPIIHYPHKIFRDFIKNVNVYSSIHAKENYKEGKNSSILKIIIIPVAKFINNYVYKLGFLDGSFGFVVSATMSFHSFLSWSKLWLIQRKS